VGREKDRAAGLPCEVAQQTHRLEPARKVEERGDLIEHQHPRLLREGAGDQRTLLFTIAEFGAGPLGQGRGRRTVV